MKCIEFSLEFRSKVSNPLREKMINAFFSFLQLRENSITYSLNQHSKFKCKIGSKNLFAVCASLLRSFKLQPHFFRCYTFIDSIIIVESSKKKKLMLRQDRMSAQLSEAAVEQGDTKMLILNAVAAASAESTPLVVGCIFKS